jgi:hypothetical protein
MRSLTNENILDRGFRILVGVVLLSLVFWGPHTMFGWLGVVPLVTGLVGFCPIYKVFGLSTCPARRT